MEHSVSKTSLWAQLSALFTGGQTTLEERKLVAEHMQCKPAAKVDDFSPEAVRKMVERGATFPEVPPRG
jgi:hypothetical protein